MLEFNFVNKSRELACMIQILSEKKRGKESKKEKKYIYSEFSLKIKLISGRNASAGKIYKFGGKNSAQTKKPLFFRERKLNIFFLNILYSEWQNTPLC